MRTPNSPSRRHGRTGHRSTLPRMVAVGLVVLAASRLRAADVPGHVAASVSVSGCSGTVIRRDGRTAWILSAAHCFDDGQAVRFKTGDKKKTGNGLVVLVDTDADLSLIRCRVVDTTGVATVPPARPPGDFELVGYPKGDGPTVARLTFRGPEKITNLPRPRWAFDVHGKFRRGSSGSGVFVGGRLVAVATHGEDDRELYAATLDDVRSFLKRAEKEFRAAILPPRAGMPDPPVVSVPFRFGPAGWGDRDRTREIVELKKRISELETLVGNLRAKAGPPGPPGPPGRVDAVALDRIQKQLNALDEWRRTFRATLRVTVKPKGKN